MRTTGKLTAPQAAMLRLLGDIGATPGSQPVGARRLASLRYSIDNVHLIRQRVPIVERVLDALIGRALVERVFDRSGRYIVLRYRLTAAGAAMLANNQEVQGA